MALPFEPAWTFVLTAERPDEAEDADAPGLIRTLGELGFRRLGFATSRGLGDHAARFVDRRDDEEMDRRWVRGECSALFVDAAGTSVGEQSRTFGTDHLRFRSLLADGTLLETRLVPARRPVVTLPEWAGSGVRPENVDNAGDPRVDAVVTGFLERLSGRTEDGDRPDLPLAGLRVVNLAVEPEALWRHHQARLAGRSAVRLDEPGLVEAAYLRAQHAQLAHTALVLAASGWYDALTWLAVVGPPLLLVAAWPTCPAVGVGAVWTLAMWGLGRDLLIVVGPYRVLTPLLRWWPAPRKVPADRLRAIYAVDRVTG